MRELRAGTTLLDGFNRLRFAPDSSALGEWNRLKRLLGAPRRKRGLDVMDPDATPLV